jgi:hypothetical protein
VSIFDDILKGFEPSKPTQPDAAALKRSEKIGKVLGIYGRALTELACQGDPEAPPYAKIARRALREAQEVRDS